MSLKKFSIKSYGQTLMDHLFENLPTVCLTVQCVDIKCSFLLVRDVYKIFWVFGKTNQIRLYEE